MTSSPSRSLLLNTSNWYLAASDEEYFDPTPDVRAGTNTSSTRLETPAGQSERQLHTSELKMEQLQQAHALRSRNAPGGHTSISALGRRLNMFRTAEATQKARPTLYGRIPCPPALAATMTCLPPPVPRTPLAAPRGPPASASSLMPTSSIPVSARSGGNSASATAQPLRIRIKKIKLPKLKANKELYDVFKEL